MTKRHHYSPEDLVEAWKKDLENDIQFAREIAAKTDSAKEREMNLRYAETCEQELLNPEASLREALRGTR